MKVAINVCYGGFGLSLVAEKEYWKRKGVDVFFYEQTKYSFRDGKDEYKRVGVDPDDLFVHTVNIDLGETCNELPDGCYVGSGLERNDPDLIAIIEEFGDKASGRCAELKVVEIPDGIEWEIDEYDGSESIEEKHRSWS